MIEFVQQLINGLALGLIYALIALGYTMVYGVLRFINFAHGDIYMVGAFAGFYLAPVILPLFPAGSAFSAAVAGLVILLLAMAICAALGVLIERIAYRPLRQRPRLTVLITAIGVSLFLENFFQFAVGAEPKGFPEIIPDNALDVPGGLTITTSQVLVLIVTLALLAGLSYTVLKTRMGLAMRAVSLNPIAAALMGVNNDAVISFTFGLGSALAAAAGILYSIGYPSIDPLMGILPGLKAFVAAVFGGIGSLPGAVVGGLIIGVIETFVVGYISPAYRDAIAFAILILILLFKPSGLFGRTEREKV